jgi:hypothetical protein
MFKTHLLVEIYKKKHKKTKSRQGKRETDTQMIEIKAFTIEDTYKKRREHYQP